MGEVSNVDQPPSNENAQPSNEHAGVSWVRTMAAVGLAAAVYGITTLQETRRTREAREQLAEAKRTGAPTDDIVRAIHRYANEGLDDHADSELQRLRAENS